MRLITWIEVSPVDYHFNRQLILVRCKKVIKELKMFRSAYYLNVLLRTNCRPVPSEYTNCWCFLKEKWKQHHESERQLFQGSIRSKMHMENICAEGV